MKTGEKVFVALVALAIIGVLLWIHDSSTVGRDYDSSVTSVWEH